MAESLLAHLIPRIRVAQEPVATKALAYILNAASELARQFVTVVAETGTPSFMPGRIAAEERHEGSVPDLTVRDTSGAVRILIENKFWSGLTDAQPVAYLEQLPPDMPTVLVFLVPHSRMYSIWSELKNRCTRNKIDLADESKTDDVIWARTGNRTLAITSWKYVLEKLRQAASASGHTAVEQDVLQLRGLTDQMNADEFLPLREDEITDVSLAQRLINYTQLIDEVTERLEANGVADTKGLRHVQWDYTWAGRDVRLYKRFGGWMGVDLKAWRDSGITPFWWTINTSVSFSGVNGEHPARIQNLFEEAQDSDDEWVYIPIRLRTGVERDRVVDDVVEQVCGIADRLREAFPTT